MTVEAAAYLVYVARISGYIYAHIQTKGRYIPSTFVWFGMSFYLAVNLSRLFSLNYICEKISAKVNIHICAYMCIHYEYILLILYIIYLLIKSYNVSYVVLQLSILG